MESSRLPSPPGQAGKVEKRRTDRLSGSFQDDRKAGPSLFKTTGGKHNTGSFLLTTIKVFWGGRGVTSMICLSKDLMSRHNRYTLLI